VEGGSPDWTKPKFKPSYKGAERDPDYNLNAENSPWTKPKVKPSYKGAERDQDYNLNLNREGGDGYTKPNYKTSYKAGNRDGNREGNREEDIWNSVISKDEAGTGGAGPEERKTPKEKKKTYDNRKWDHPQEEYEYEEKKEVVEAKPVTKIEFTMKKVSGLGDLFKKKDKK